MSLKESIEATRLRAGAWWRERKERAADRKAARHLAAAHDPHAHSRFWLLNVPAIATVCAAIVEWYWAMLFCIQATGRLGLDWSTATASDAPAQGAWHFLFDIQNLPVLLGLVGATIPIVMLSMVWLPVQFAMRGAGVWRRGSIITVGVLANILVIVSGTVVMNYNRQDQVREATVVEQTAQQGRAAIDARLAFEQDQLRLALSNTNPYLNQAANVGAAEWERSYVTQARATNDPRLPMLERALGAARAADQRRANIEALTVQRAQAAPEAATAANVEDTVGRELNITAQYIEVWRPPFVAFICTLIGIFGAWWTLAMLERLNPRDVLRSGWATDAERIEDLREQEPVAAKPMKPARRKFTEAETGEEVEQTLVPAHYRTIKRGDKPVAVEIKPDVPPDETGAVDGGHREASVVPGEFVAPDVAEAADTNADQQDEGRGAEVQGVRYEPVDHFSGDAHPEPPEPRTPEEDAAIDAELAATEQPEEQHVDDADTAADDDEAQNSLQESAIVPTQPNDASHDEANADSGEPSFDVSTQDEPPSREPETRPERMLAAAK